MQEFTGAGIRPALGCQDMLRIAIFTQTNLVQATILAIAAPTEDAVVDGCSWNESVIKTSLRPEVDPSSVLASLTIHGFRLRILSRRRRLGFLHFLLVRP